MVLIIQKRPTMLRVLNAEHLLINHLMVHAFLVVSLNAIFTVAIKINSVDIALQGETHGNHETFKYPG